MNFYNNNALLFAYATSEMLVYI